MCMFQCDIAYWFTCYLSAAFLHLCVCWDRLHKRVCGCESELSFFVQCEWVQQRVGSSIRELKLKGMCGNVCWGAFMSRPIVHIQHTHSSSTSFSFPLFLSLLLSHTFNCSLLITAILNWENASPLHCSLSFPACSSFYLMFCLSQDKQSLSVGWSGNPNPPILNIVTASSLLFFFLRLVFIVCLTVLLLYVYYAVFCSWNI